MNCIICIKGSDKIEHYIENCVQVGNSFQGDNKRVDLKPHLFDIYWTDEKPTILYDAVQKGKKQRVVGFREKAGQLKKKNPPKHRVNRKNLSRQQRIDILERLEDIADLSFADIDQQIDELRDFDEAKEYLKKLSKVVLGITKITKQWEK